MVRQMVAHALDIRVRIIHGQVVRADGRTVLVGQRLIIRRSLHEVFFAVTGEAQLVADVRPLKTLGCYAAV